jgi:hypothetical protein
MSAPPQIDMNTQHTSGLDDIPSGMYADPQPKVAEQKEPQQFITKESILNCKVGDKASSANCRDPANVKHNSLICSTHAIRFPSLTTHKAAQSAMSAVQNHPTTQNLKETMNNGEVCIGCNLVWNLNFGANVGRATQLLNFGPSPATILIPNRTRSPECEG